MAVNNYRAGHESCVGSGGVGGGGFLWGWEAIFSLSYQRLAARIPKHESLVVTSRDLLWEFYISLRRDGSTRLYATGFS